MEEDKVVFIKVFDKKTGHVLFEGKVSTEVQPYDLVHLRCFRERYLETLYNKATDERVESLMGLQNNVELVASIDGDYREFSGVLYVDAEDGVLRRSKCVPSCECKMMSLCELSNEGSEVVFKCETLEELEINGCGLMRIPSDVGRMKMLKKLRLYELNELRSIAEEVGELSSLEELWIEWSAIESLPKRLNELKMLKSIVLVGLDNVQLNTEDFAVFSKSKQLRTVSCDKAFTPLIEKSFWEMVKSTTAIRLLELNWKWQNQEMVAESLDENGSIVGGGWWYESYMPFFNRNKENHARAMECVVYLLAVRRWRDALNSVPKEMVRMIAMALWNTKCDVGAWTHIRNF